MPERPCGLRSRTHLALSSVKLCNDVIYRLAEHCVALRSFSTGEVAASSPSRHSSAMTPRRSRKIRCFPLSPFSTHSPDPGTRVQLLCEPPPRRRSAITPRIVLASAGRLLLRSKGPAFSSRKGYCWCPPCSDGCTACRLNLSAAGDSRHARQRMNLAVSLTRCLD